MQDGINLAGRLPIASNGLSGGYPTTEAELKAASQGGKDSDGSPCGILPAYHTRRQQWSGFFCLLTGAGIRGVRGAVSLGPVWNCTVYATKKALFLFRYSPAEKTFHAGPSGNSGIRYARISRES